MAAAQIIAIARGMNDNVERKREAGEEGKGKGRIKKIDERWYSKH